jgi:oligopeptide/dipeptide ABC transporter ATP-binding protein
MQDLLKIVELHVHYAEPRSKRVHAVNGVDLAIRSGEILAILGESGCGKSTLAKMLMRLLSPNARVTRGQVQFDGQDLLSLGETELTHIRGARLSVVPQDPASALNPVIKVGDQISEVLRAHRNLSWKDCQKEALRLLQQVGLIEASRNIYDAYPHQLSGGQQQRVAIAQAVSCEPALLIADEPTSSLDPETEREVLQLLRDLQSKTNLSVLLITHDPTILPGLADRVAVMYAGRIVEVGAVTNLFQNPKHPYTQALLACAPNSSALNQASSRARFDEIPGSAPDPESLPLGCSFAPRCTQRMHECAIDAPSSKWIESSRSVECFLYGH